MRAFTLECKWDWTEHLPFIEFSYNNSYQQSIVEALYGRPCRSPLCWNELGEPATLGPELVRETTEVVSGIQRIMQRAQSHQKSYADKRRRPLEFYVGVLVFLKMSTLKHVARFGLQDKLSPKYIGPYEVQEKTGRVAYRIELQPELSGFLDIFHVTMLKNCWPDPKEIVIVEPENVEKDVTMKVVSVEIFQREKEKLRNKTVPMVVMLWRSEDVEERTREPRAKMEKLPPQLFRQME